MTEFVLSIYRFLSQRKWLLYTLLTVSTLLFVYLGLKVEYEEDITKLLPSTGESEGNMAFSQLRVKDKIFILVTSRDAEEPVSSDDLISAIDSLTESLMEKDSADGRIDDILYTIDEELLLDAAMYLSDNLPVFLGDEERSVLDSLTTEKSIAENVKAGRDLLTTPTGMMLKDLIAADPIGLRKILLGKMKNVRSSLGSNQILVDGHLFTPDTTVALAYISPAFQSFDSQSGKKLVELIENEVKEQEAKNPDIKIYFHGAPVQSANNSRQVKKDLSLTLAISITLVCIVIWLCFKNKSTIPLLISPVVYGAFFALTMMYLVKGTMSLMALGIGAIVLGVALSYCLHVITHYKYVSSPERVLRDQATPVFLGALTTIGSFLGLMFTNSELLKDFGLFASFSLVGTTVFSLIFLPHFFNPERNRKSKKAFRALERFNSHRFEKHTWLIAVIAVVTLVCFYTQKWVSFDADLRHISYTSADVKASTELLASKTQPGYVTTYYAAEDTSLDAALTKSRKVIENLGALKKKGKVKGYSMVASIFPTQEEQEANIDAWKAYWTDEKVATTMAIVEKECKNQGINPSFFAPFKNLITADYETISPYEDEILPAGLMANLIEQTGGKYLVYTSVQLKEDDKKEVGKALVEATGCTVVDPMFYTEEMVKSINEDFNIALNISMAFVFVILLLSFKDILLAILAFIPMTLSWFIVLGVMGILGLQFNLINIVISTFIFGIGVDYSIFVMDGLLSKAKLQSEPQLLVYHKTAIFFSAVVLVVSTGSLLMATHPALSSIGIATIIGMSSAVVLAYTLQPFMYHALVKFLMKKGIKTKWLK